MPVLCPFFDDATSSFSDVLRRSAPHLLPLLFACCAERMQLRATIDTRVVIQRILTHLGLPGARAGPRAAVLRCCGGSRVTGPR